MKRKKKNAVMFLIGAGIVFLSGCATTNISTPPPANIPGTFHRVERGQTLWRISKIYDVDLDELARVNHIPDTTSVEIGQLLLIPGAKKPQKIARDYSYEDFIWPLRGRTVSSFGQTAGNMINKGLNIAPLGNLNVVAARSGRVAFYEDNFLAFGKTLIIDHGDGFLTVYSRNAEVFVKVGDNVKKGDTIARVGSSGRDKSTYLHFEIRKGHRPKNPYFYLPR